MARDGSRLDEGWPRSGTLLLVEERRFDAVGVTLHRQRPALEVREQERRNLDVVRDHLALAESGLWVINLFQVRDGQVFARYF